MKFMMQIESEISEIEKIDAIDLRFQWHLLIINGIFFWSLRVNFNDLSRLWALHS
jgi:hypothetical protein